MNDMARPPWKTAFGHYRFGRKAAHKEEPELFLMIFMNYGEAQCQNFARYPHQNDGICHEGSRIA
jgi:hypothetical protein